MGKYGVILEGRHGTQVESAQIGDIQWTTIQETIQCPSQQEDQQMKVAQEELDCIREAVTHFQNKKIQDPRPDLKEDSRLWHKLLKLAYEKNKNLAGVLHGFRCMGTRIKKVGDDWVLRPQIDLTGNLAWSSEDDYRENATIWLQPYRNEVIELLSQLKKDGSR